METQPAQGLQAKMIAASKSLFVYAAVTLLVIAPATAQTLGQGQTVRHVRIPVSEESQPPELLQAETALEKKDFAAAEQLLKQALSQDTNNYRAWFDLGYLYTATGRRDEATEAYRKSVAAKPDVFESNLNLGLSLAQTGNNKEAEDFLRKATELKPSAHPEQGLARAWISLGHVLEGRQPQEALKAFREAGKLEPKNVESHLSSGAILERQEDLSAAESEYQQALSLDANNSDALVGLVNVYTEGKKLPEAESALKRYLAAQPKDGRAHIQLGRVLAAENKPDQAMQELEIGMKIAPDDPKAQRDLAAVYDAMGKLDQAEAQYRGLLSRDPNDSEVHFGLGTVLMREKKFSEAQAELLNAVKLKPDLAEAYGNLAVTASENGNYDLTLKALNGRSKFLPENAGTYFLRATALDHLKQYKLAAQNYRAFLQASNGKNPEREWQAQHRLIAIDPHKK